MPTDHLEEYVPDSQDIRDFEEFALEREHDEHMAKFGRTKLRQYLFPCSSTDGYKHILRTTAIDIIQTCLSELSDYASYSRQQILDVLNLYRISKDIVREILDPTLSENDFDMIIENKTSFPYLNTLWNSVFSSASIEVHRQLINDPVCKGYVLPYASFFEEKSTSKFYPKEILMEMIHSKLQLIDHIRPEFRPLMSFRDPNVSALQKYSFDENIHLTEAFTKCVKRTLRNMNHLPTEVLRYQFGINIHSPTHSLSGSTMVATLWNEALLYFTAYFDIPYFGKLEHPTQKALKYTLPEWNNSDYQDNGVVLVI